MMICHQSEAYFICLYEIIIHTLIKWSRGDLFTKQQYARPVRCSKKQQFAFELKNKTV